MRKILFNRRKAWQKVFAGPFLLDGNNNLITATVNLSETTEKGI